MESNARMLNPEVLLRTMCYLTADRSQVEPFSPNVWINAERAYGYAQGDKYRFKSYDNPEMTGEYVVVDPPLLGSRPRRTDEGNTVYVPMVTIHFAPIAMWIVMDKLPDKGQIK